MIEGSYGLGEAIVSGMVSPDSFVVRKDLIGNLIPYPSETSPLKGERSSLSSQGGSDPVLSRNLATKTRGLFRSENGGNEWRDIP